MIMALASSEDTSMNSGNPRIPRMSANGAKVFKIFINME